MLLVVDTPLNGPMYNHAAVRRFSSKATFFEQSVSFTPFIMLKLTMMHRATNCCEYQVTKTAGNYCFAFMQLLFSSNIIVAHLRRNSLSYASGT